MSSTLRLVPFYNSDKFIYFPFVKSCKTDYLVNALALEVQPYRLVLEFFLCKLRFRLLLSEYQLIDLLGAIPCKLCDLGS